MNIKMSITINKEVLYVIKTFAICMYRLLRLHYIYIYGWHRIQVDINMWHINQYGSQKDADTLYLYVLKT